MTSGSDQAIITPDPSAAQIIPDNLVLTRQAAYAQPTPLIALLEGADHVQGMIAGLDHRGVEWLRVLVRRPSLRSVHLVLAVYAGGPTWDDVLRDALEIQQESGGKVSFRLLARRGGPDRPANLLWIRLPDQATSMVITGNVSNALLVDQWDPTDAVLTLPIDAVAEDALHKWFDLLTGFSRPLNDTTAAAPRLRLPDGSEEAARLWAENILRSHENPNAFPAWKAGDVRGDSVADFRVLVRTEYSATLEADHVSLPRPYVDPDTSEVQTEVEVGQAAPLARRLAFPRVDPVLLAVQRVLTKGALVSVERVGRAPPLAMPIRSELFGELAQQRVGSASRRQTFSVSLFDEKSRKLLDGRHDALSIKLAAFSLMMREGQRWMPQMAFALFDAEITDARHKSEAALLRAIGVPATDSMEAERKTEAAGAFVAGLSVKVARDLTDLAAQIGARSRPTQSFMDEVLTGLKQRLEANLAKGMVPNISRTQAQLWVREDVNQTPWGTVQRFLASAARLPRQVLTDPFRMNGLVITRDELLRAFDPFEDPLVRKFLDGSRVEDQAGDELRLIDHIEAQDACTPWQRAQALYLLISGKGEAAVQQALKKERGPS